jgi:peptidoglycan/xylan/chitin deacetylase (PgdA/CDA1 family)
MAIVPRSFSGKTLLVHAVQIAKITTTATAATIAAATTSSLIAGCAPNHGSAQAPIAAEANSTEDLFQQKNIGAFGLSGTKKVVITFDDGPSKNTAALLTVLRDQDVTASFFMLGQNIVGHDAALRQMKADHHIVANHTLSHVNLREVKYLSDTSALIRQIVNTHELLKPFFQPAQRMYFRAPYGNWRSQHADVLNSNSVMATYIGPIFWTIGGELRYDSSGKVYSSADWDCWGKGVSVETCAEGYLRETERQQGGVILMHDVDSRSVRLAKIVIAELKARGYKFVSLDDLRSLDQYE